MSKGFFVFGVLLIWGCLNPDEFISSQKFKDLLARKPENFYLVDVRTPQEYREGHIPGAININHTDILLTPPTTDKDAILVVYCRSGNRSGQALRALKQAGYREVYNFGAISNWTDNLVR